MDRQVTFEVHVKQRNRWEIHARHDVIGEAIEEAKTLDMMASIEEVKVVRDTYNPETGGSTETTAYRSPKGKEKRRNLAAARFPRSSRRSHRLTAYFSPEPGFFDDNIKIGKRSGENRPHTFATTLIKVLLIVLFSVAIAGLLAFGSVVFLRDTTFESNVQTNIVFITFVAAFLFSIFVMSMNFLKKDTLTGPKRHRPIPSPEQKTAKPPNPTPAPEISQFEAGAPGAPPSVESLASNAGQTETAEGPRTAEPEPAEPPDASEPEPAPQTEKPSRLSPHAERQRVTLMRFLGDGLEKMPSDASRLDSFNKFGINFYLAGGLEALGGKFMLDGRSTSIILSETISIVGFKESEVAEFIDKYEEYLLADSRYMQIFEAGRNAMNAHLDDNQEAGEYLQQALNEWSQAKPAQRNDGVVTVMFTAIAGSGAPPPKPGDDAARQTVHSHNRLVREALNDFGGVEIKRTGDGIMASFKTPLDGVEGAIRMQRKITAYNKRNPGLHLHVKIGINAGELAAEDDDLFGSMVRMAASVVDKAGRDKIFISDTVRGACEGGKLHFKNRGLFEMKNFDQPATIYEVLWRNS